MPDNEQPTSPTDADHPATVISQSSGVDIDAQGNVIIGGDVVGRDKITQTTITEEVAYKVDGLENPYLGLSPFTYKERSIYAGRDDEIDDAVARLTAPGAQQVLLFVTGASGSGKSSFVQAGLLPRLEDWYTRRNRTVKLAVFRPARDPMEMLQDALSQLGKGIRQLDDLTSLDQVSLIVIDQFEELFTQAKAGPRAEFVALLQALPQFDQNHAHFIATLRSDYLKELFELKSLWDVAKHGIELRTMSEVSLSKAILKPLQEKHPDKRMEPELLATLAHDAAENVTYLPLLQVTLQKLWKQGRLQCADYTNLANSITHRAETVYGFTDHARQLPRDQRPQADQNTILKIFLDLVQVSLDDDTRRDVRRRQAKTALIAESRDRTRLVEDLVGARLLSVTTAWHGEQKIEYVDIIHEALIREWARFQQTIKDNRQQLQWRERFVQRLRDWQQRGRSDRGLLSDVHLEEARQLRERKDIALRDEDARAFLRCSEEKLETDLQHEREQTERLRIAFASARSRELARVALNQQSVNQTQALLVAIEAAKIYSGTAAEDTLRRILLAHTQLVILTGHESRTLRAQFSPDGWRIVTASLDKTARIWDAETGRELAVLRGHDDGVLHAQFSPDGRRIVTAGADRTARIWDAETGHELAVLRGHEKEVTSAQFAPDGQRILTTCDDKTARVWDAETGRELAILRGHGLEVSSAQYASDGHRIVTASADKTARVWDGDTGRKLAVLRGHKDKVTAALFSPNDRCIVTTSADHTIRVWNSNTGRHWSVLRGHGHSLWSAQFAPNDWRIVGISGDNTVRVWDILAQRELAVLHGHEEQVTGAQFSPDGQYIVTASLDNTVRLWATNTGRELAVLRGHDSEVWSAQFSPDGGRIVTASSDKTARVWSASTDRELTALYRHDSKIRSACFSPDGWRIFTAGDDNIARMWDANTGHELAVMYGHDGFIWRGQFAPNGRRIVTASQDGTARVWDVNTGRELIILRGHEGIVLSAWFSPDGRHIVTIDDNTARIWDANTGRELVIWCRHEDIVISTFFVANSLHIVTASSDGIVRVCNANTDRELAVLGEHKGGLHVAQFSPDGRRIVIASNDKNAHLWDSAIGRELAVLRGHESKVTSARFAPDGRHLVTGSDDSTARIWDVETGHELAVLRGHESRVTSARFAPDGQRIVTASDDKTARIWDANHGRELAVLRGHKEEVTNAEFSPDGRHIATTSYDGIVRIYFVYIEDLIAQAKKRANRELTPKEREAFLVEGDEMLASE